MKKFVFLLFIIFYTTLTFGQQNKFDIGAEAGPSLTFLRGNEILKEFNRPMISLSGGLFFKYHFPKTISIKTGIAFERKGAVAEATFLDANGNITGNFKLNSNFDYVTTPILITTSVGKKVKFFVCAGPFFSYLIRHTLINQGINIVPTLGNNTFLYKPFDFGLTGGLGITIPIKEKFYLSYEIRNNLGLYNISDVPVFNNGTIKINSTNVLIGFAYKFGTREILKNKNEL